MFKLKTGNSLNTPDPTIVQYQCVTIAAIHELHDHCVKETEILFNHQLAIKNYYYENLGIDSNIENPLELFKLVTNFHIFDESGLCKRLEPLVLSITTGEPVETTDPIIEKILVESDKYRQDVFNKNFRKVEKQVNKVDKISDSTFAEKIESSYAKESDTVDFLVLTNKRVQCRCNYCKKFFNMTKKMETIDYTKLNLLQQLLSDAYDFDSIPDT